jgi:hypothetical protein
MWFIRRQAEITYNKAEWSNLRILGGETKEIQKHLWEPVLKQILLLNINMKYFTTYEN